MQAINKTKMLIFSYGNNKQVVFTGLTSTDQWDCLNNVSYPHTGELINN